jgi:hypothetical protein
MTTDERLDRLIERHEALAESVELLAKAAAASDIEALTRLARDLAAIAGFHNDRLKDLEEATNG